MNRRPARSLREFWKQHAAWSQAQFGTDAERGPIGPLKHLEKEAREAYSEDNWHKRVDEIADCLLLTLDAARRHGLSFDELVEAAFSKLARNKQRKWPTGISDEPVEHIRGIA